MAGAVDGEIGWLCLEVPDSAGRNAGTPGI